MAALTTDAIVLHSFDYLETSRILRLATREGGVRSVLARGARRSSRRFGAALDLFAEGVAEIHTRPGRDLDTLAGFDVRRSRPQLGEDLGRFLGASAIAELTLRFAQNADTTIYDAVIGAISSIAAASSEGARVATLAGAWRLVSELGFAPTVDSCADCHESLSPEESAMFSHPAGGTVCRRCARLSVAGRLLPGDARDALVRWTRGELAVVEDSSAIRAHQRLLREFLREHLADERPLRAVDAWMRDDLTPLHAAAGVR